MANSYIPKWQNISVNFNDANSMMNTAMGGISKAGTVFSKLRDDIAAEEQRAAEAAYKQQIFDENVRQFEAQQLWNREKAIADREHDITLQKQRQDFEKEQNKLAFERDMQKIAKQHQNAVALKGLERTKEQRNSERYNAAANLAATTYKQYRQSGATQEETANAIASVLRTNNLSDVPLAVEDYVPVNEVNQFKTISSPEYQAVKAAENMLTTGAMSWDAKGKQQDLDTYKTFFDRLVSGDDGTVGIRDQTTGELRPLTVEEQAYFNKNADLNVADQYGTYPELIKALRQKVLDSGMDVATAETIGKRKLSAIGTEDIYKEAAISRGADISKVVPVDVATNAATARAKKQAEAKIIEQAKEDARTNSKSSTYSDHLVKFLDNHKVAGEDGKSMLNGLSDEVLTQVFSTRDQFIQFDIPASKYKEYLSIVGQNLRYNANKSWYEFSGTFAKTYAANLIEEAKKTKGTDGTGNNGNNSGNNETKPEPGNGLVGLGNSPQENKPTPEAMRDIPKDTSKMDDAIFADPRQTIVNLRNSYTQMFKKDGSLVTGAIGFGSPEKALQRAEQLKTKEKNLTKVLDSLKANKHVDPSSEEAKIVKDTLLTMRNRYKNQRRATDENLQYLARIEQLLKLFEKGE